MFRTSLDVTGHAQRQFDCHTCTTRSRTWHGHEKRSSDVDRNGQRFDARHVLAAATDTGHRDLVVDFVDADTAVLHRTNSPLKWNSMVYGWILCAFCGLPLDPGGCGGEL